jgi:hypothetical protein
VETGFDDIEAIAEEEESLDKEEADFKQQIMENVLNSKFHGIGTGLETILEEDNYSPKYESHN